MSVFPRSLPEEIGGFPAHHRRAEDWHFWIRAIFAGYRVWHQPRPLALYRWGTESLVSDWRATDDGGDGRAPRARRDPRAIRARSARSWTRRLAAAGPRTISRQADEALRDGRYGEAASAYHRAAALARHESRLVWKARLMAVAPWATGPVLRARQRRIEHELAIDERHVR